MQLKSSHGCKRHGRLAGIHNSRYSLRGSASGEGKSTGHDIGVSVDRSWPFTNRTGCFHGTVIDVQHQVTVTKNWVRMTLDKHRSSDGVFCDDLLESVYFTRGHNALRFRADLLHKNGQTNEGFRT